MLKNADGTDFVADENDIIEWDGTKWNMVFDASTDDGSTIHTQLILTQVSHINGMV